MLHPSMLQLDSVRVRREKVENSIQVSYGLTQLRWVKRKEEKGGQTEEACPSMMRWLGKWWEGEKKKGWRGNSLEYV